MIWDALVGASSSARFSCWVGDRYETTAWSEVARSAERMTAGLRAAGVGPGARVASILTNAPSTTRGVLATWLAGGTIASLPVPARGMSAGEYASQLAAICDEFGATLLVVEDQMLPAVPERLRPLARSWESFEDSGTVAPSPPEEDEIAFVQYSSGSTGSPKGCMLTSRAIASQLDLLVDMMDAGPSDTAVIWLPLSHDMGMFGQLLTPWAYGFSLVLSTPQRFAFSPSTWFADAARFGATMTAGTNTALHLAARTFRPGRLSQPLRVRLCFVGAERVRAETLALASEALAPAGFRPEAWMPAYGLAEATLAVTATPVREAPREIVVDSVALADRELEEVEPDHPSATRLVSAGVPGKGVELPDAPTAAVGEIQVRSPSLAAGYFGRPELTRERFRDGTLLTGDLGFVRDGHLYPVGRLDDVISIAGRNVYTSEIEAAIDDLDPVRRGCSAIVEAGEGARSRFTLLVELRGPLHDYQALAGDAAAVARAKAALALDECVMLPKGSLPKTPSGKIQRHRCRHMLESGRFDPLAVVELAAV